MRWFLAIITFFIIYGSLYPFNFVLNTIEKSQVNHLFNFALSASSGANAISNIVLFIPFGFLAMNSFNRKTSLYIKFVITLVTGFILAFGIQVFQLFTVERLPSGSDASWNMIGCLLGMLIADIKLPKTAYFEQIRHTTLLIPFALSCALLLYNFAPFVPSLDWGLLKNNLKAIIEFREFNIYWTLEKTILWLVAFYLLTQTPIQKNENKLILSIAFSILFIKLFIVTNGLTIDNIIAGISALILWFSTRPLMTTKNVMLLLFIGIIIMNFEPFELNQHVSHFSLIPFSGSLGGNLIVNIFAVSKKILIYACFIWLLYLQNNNMTKSTYLVAALVFVIEFLQIFFVSASAEITDSILVIMTGLVFKQIITHKVNLTNTIDKSISEPVVRESLSVPQYQRLDQVRGMEGLRAFAALSVFLVHFNQQVNFQGSFLSFDIQRWLENGNTGVALFFVLSGFLLSLPFWRYKMKNTDFPNVLSYFSRRSARIIPAYYVSLSILVILVILTSHSFDIGNFISHLLFLHNFSDDTIFSYNPPFWTLAVEVQFYILLPCIFWLLKKQSLNKTFYLILAAIPSLYLLNYLLVETISHSFVDNAQLFSNELNQESVSSEKPSLTYSTLAHLPHFLIGVVTALIFLKRNRIVNNAKQAEIIFWLSSLSILVILATPLDDILQLNHARYNFPFVPLLIAIILLTVTKTKVAIKILETPVIAGLGLISYGIYIFHYPIMRGVTLLFQYVGWAKQDDYLLYGIISLLLTIFAAYLSYKLIEQPVINWAKVSGRRTTNVNLNNSIETNSLSGNKLEIRSSEGNIRPELNTSKKINNGKNHKKYYWIVGASIVVVVTSLIGVFKPLDKQLSSVYWASQKSNIIFDHHAHSTFSDGSLEMAELAELAYISGCQAMVISDHSAASTTANAEQLKTIEQLRNVYPGMLILAAIELGMPDLADREHVNILVHPEQEKQVLTRVMQKISSKSASNLLNDDDLMQLLIDEKNNKAQLVAIYNHPSRYDADEAENLVDINRWNKNNQVITAISGAPGHQKATTIGNYKAPLLTQDRWDPAIAVVGSTWDQLLSTGQQIWGAIASSDYHEHTDDYPPCSFARIHVVAPYLNYTGLLSALQAGTFWADHGKILEQLSFSVDIDKIDERAYPGSVVKSIAIGEVVSANFRVKRGIGSKNSPLEVEIVSNCLTGRPKLISTHFLDANKENLTTLIPIMAKGQDQKSCYIRARIRKRNISEPDFMAYTNHIRFMFK